MKLGRKHAWSRYFLKGRSQAEDETFGGGVTRPVCVQVTGSCVWMDGWMDVGWVVARDMIDVCIRMDVWRRIE